MSPATRKAKSRTAGSGTMPPTEQAQPPGLEQPFTVEEVAAFLKAKNTRPVLGLIRAGKLKAFRLGRRYLVLPRHLGDYLEAAVAEKEDCP